MEEGYILSNKYRRAIFDGFVSGEKNLMSIAKKNRIVPIIAKRILEDFLKGGIIEQKEKGYVLTDKGKKLASMI